MKEYHLNKNARRVVIAGTELVGNINNGAFIVLDDEGSKFIDLVEEKKHIERKCYSRNIRKLIKACVENAIFEGKDENQKISAAYLHLTDKCNLHCIGCYSNVPNRNNQESLDTESIKSILKKLGDNKVKTLVFSGGEPFLRPDLVEILKYARKRAHIRKIILATNGTIIQEKVLRKIKRYTTYVSVSVDGFDDNKCDYIRDKGTFSKVCHFIETAEKLRVRISLLPTIHKENYRDLDFYSQFATKHHLPISFSLLTCNSFETSIAEYVISDAELSEVLGQNENTMFEDVPVNLKDYYFKESCGAGRTMISIDAHGKVYPCHMLQNDMFLMGDILSESLTDIMNRAEDMPIVNKGVNTNEGCPECIFKYFCGGGCKARAFYSNGEYYNKDPYCNAYKERFYCLEDELNKLLSQK